MRYFRLVPPLGKGSVASRDEGGSVVADGIWQSEFAALGRAPQSQSVLNWPGADGQVLERLGPRSYRS